MGEHYSDAALDLDDAFRRYLLRERRALERRKQASRDAEERYELASQLCRVSALLVRLQARRDAEEAAA